MELNFAKTFEILTAAFGESTMSKTQVKLWYNRFKCSSPTLSITDETIEAVKKRISIREFADDFVVPLGS